MAKKRRVSRQDKRAQRETNWLLIGGVIAAVLVVGGLFYLLFLSLQEQETPQVAQTLMEYCQENPENCISKGAADAPVTIVEISDYACPACKNFNLETAPLLEDLYVRSGQVKWVSLPYASSARTETAAKAAMCVAEQEAYFEFHERLFEMQGQPEVLTANGLRQVAEELGLDVESYGACMSRSSYDETVQDNVAAALSAGVRVTPSFFVEETYLRGNQPLTSFQGVINSLLSAS